MNALKIHKIWWFWLPVFIMIVQIILEITLPSQILAPLHSETGPHETFQAMIIFSAFFVALRTLFLTSFKKDMWLWLWIFTAALCCLYVGGEETSWGQHILDWDTPDFWAQVNDQGETNLHNTSSWLDQKPRLILLIGVIIGGLIIPLLQRFKSNWVPQRFALIYPPAELGLISFFALAIQIIDTIDDAARNIVLFERASEVQEIYLFFFVLLYLIVLHRRVMQHQR